MAKPVLGKSVRSDWFFLRRDFVVQTIAMETVEAMYFCFGAKLANSNFATKTAKKKCEYCHSSQQKRLKFYQDFKDRWRRRTFSERVYYPEDRETFDAETETGITKSRKAIDDFINQQKSANTNKKTATDMNTILCYMEAIGMKNEKIESFPASEPDHLLSKFCLHTCKKNGEYQPATVSSFQHSIQQYLSETYCKTQRISCTPSLENQIWEKKLKRDP